MTAQTCLPSAFFQYPVEQGTKISLEAVMAHHQFIQLSAGRKILIFEAVRFARSTRTGNAKRNIVIDGGQYIASAGEKASDGTKSMFEFNGVRRVRVKGLAFSGDAIEPLALCPRSARGPKCIGKVLLNQRDFRLHGNFNVCKGSVFAAIRSHPRQNPSAALLVH